MQNLKYLRENLALNLIRVNTMQRPERALTLIDCENDSPESTSTSNILGLRYAFMDLRKMIKVTM